MAGALLKITHSGRKIRTDNWDMDLEDLRRYQSRVAVRELDRAQSEGAFPEDKKQYTTVVDGRSGHGRERSVRLGGRIAYLAFDAATDWLVGALEVIRMIYRQIPFSAKKKSDRDSRVAFRQRHYMYSMVMLRNNGLVVGPGSGFRADAENYLRKFANTMGPGDVISITNIQPYARRIDQGAPFKKPWSKQSPRGVLERVYREMPRRNKTKALFRDYEMRPLPGGIADAIQADQGATVAYAERRRKRGKWHYTNRIVEKHRVYPVLSFGPPFQGQGRATNQPRAQWTHRGNISRVLTQGGVTRVSRAGPVSGQTPVIVRRGPPLSPGTQFKFRNIRMTVR